MLYALIFTAVMVAGLTYSALILMGLYKTPVLRAFEAYGPDEPTPMPLFSGLAWLGGAFYFGAEFVSAVPRLAVIFQASGLVCALVGGYALYQGERTKRLHDRICPYPRWLWELRGRTTRYERRRIAYMWLYLPVRMQLTLNSSDKLFDLWVDMVILGTIREEEKEIYDEGFYIGQQGRSYVATHSQRI